MYPGPFTLYDIIQEDSETYLEICQIKYKLKSKLRHKLERKLEPANSTKIKQCKEHNDNQFILLNECKESVLQRLRINKFSPKMRNLLKYYSSTLDHYLNWYNYNQLKPPNMPSEMVYKVGIFSANRDFSKVLIGDNTYQLSESQSKIVDALYESTREGVDGLTYKEIARRTGLTSYGKMSNYYQTQVRVKHLFNYSKGKYYLIKK